MGRGIRFKGEFQIVADTCDLSVELRKIIDEVAAYTKDASIKMCIRAGDVDVPVPFGSVLIARKVFLRSNKDVTVKFSTSDDGYINNGTSVFSGEILGIFLSAVEDADVEVIVAG